MMVPFKPCWWVHDLHLLAAAHTVRKALQARHLAHVLEAPDHPALLDWLRQQPLARTHTLA
jgi:bis(5'-nucleosyl)-tetraphosphatase (symmetrical)